VDGVSLGGARLGKIGELILIQLCSEVFVVGFCLFFLDYFHC